MKLPKSHEEGATAMLDFLVGNILNCVAAVCIRERTNIYIHYILEGNLYVGAYSLWFPICGPTNHFHNMKIVRKKRDL